MVDAQMNRKLNAPARDEPVMLLLNPCLQSKIATSGNSKEAGRGHAA